MTSEPLLDRLVSGKRLPGRHLIVVAHPDDEVIGCSGLLCSLDDVRIFQLTGDTREREAERSAAQIAGGWQIPVVFGGGRFRYSYLIAETLLAVLGRLLTEQRVDAVWTHPYESGHLDHDLAAWLVQRACGIIGDGSPQRFEFASYHLAERQVFGAFWPDAAHCARTVRLDGSRLERKLAALRAYGSQTKILRKFPAPSREEYRSAPTYDFRRPSPPPRSRWDVRGYQPSTSEWRDAMSRLEGVPA